MEGVPKDAKKVFGGVLFDVYQWDQEMYDGSMAVFERLNRPNTVETVLVTPENKIIIERQRQPDREDWFLSSVGGRIDEGEDPLVAAKREVLEESGYESDDWELLHVWRPTSKILWDDYVYVARGAQKVQEQELDGGEQIELMEVSFDELLDLIDSRELSGFSQIFREMCIRAKYDKPSYEDLKKTILG